MTKENKKTLRLARNLFKIIVERDNLNCGEYITENEVNEILNEIRRFLNEYHDYMTFEIKEKIMYTWSDELGVRILESRYMR